MTADPHLAEGIVRRSVEEFPWMDHAVLTSFLSDYSFGVEREINAQGVPVRRIVMRGAWQVDPEPPDAEGGAVRRTCFIAVCDDCGSEHEHDYTPHWPSAGEAVDDAVNTSEWWAGDGKLLCDDCRHKPHAVVPDPLYTEDCARCGNPVDEHESESVDAQHE